MNDEVFAHCQAAVPGWSQLAPEDCEFESPKGFSSFTMAVRARVGVGSSGRLLSPPGWQGKRHPGCRSGAAALPLSLQPIQKIRFIPYAHQRFNRFLDAYRARFGD